MLRQEDWDDATLTADMDWLSWLCRHIASESGQPTSEASHVVARTLKALSRLEGCLKVQSSPKVSIMPTMLSGSLFNLFDNDMAGIPRTTSYSVRYDYLYDAGRGFLGPSGMGRSSPVR